MDKLQEYSITFKGLKDGKHQFHFSIGDSFFEATEGSTIEKGNFEVDVMMNKKPTMLQLDFNIDGNVHAICDNCLGPLSTPVSYEGTLHVKFGSEYDEPTEDVIVLPHEDNKINIAALIYEYIVVSMPLRSVHEDYLKCDPEMQAKLEEYSGNHEHADTENEKTTDPRWDALKKIKHNNNK